MVKVLEPHWFPLGSPCSPRDSQESSPTPQFKSTNSSALSSLYGLKKITALTRQNFVGKVMSLLLNMLFRSVVTFLPRSNCLLISWLRLTFDLLSWVKKIHLHHSGWASSSPLRPWIEQKGKGSVNLLSSWAGTSIFSCFWTSALLYWGLWYWTDLYYWLSWFYILQIVVLLKLHNCVSQFL